MYLDVMFRRLHYACRKNLMLLSLTVWLPLITQLLLPQYIECVTYTCAVISCIVMTTDFIKCKID